MIHRLGLLVFATVTSIATFGDSPDTAKLLSSIPAEAAGFVIVPSIEQLDADLQQAIARMALQELAPPDMVSVTGLLRKYLGLSEGLDPKGTLAVVFMPTTGPEIMQTAVILPATDPEGLLRAAGAQAGEGGLWSVAPMGMPYQAVTAPGRVVVCSSADGAKAVAASKSSIAARMGETDQTAMKGQDLLVWIDGERLVGQFRQQIDGMLAMAMMMQGGNPAQTENMKKELQVWLDGMRSALIGVSLDQQGLGLRGYFASRPGTELANRLKSNKTTSGSLLAGLPAQRFMAAGGMVFSPEMSKQMMDQIDPLFEQLSTSASEANKPRLTTLKQLARDGAALISGFRLSVGRLPAGPDGLVGLAMLTDVTDSTKYMELVGKVIAEVKQLDPGQDPEAKRALEALSFETGKETIGSAAVSHLKLDLGKLEEMEEEEIEDAQKIIGKEGVTMRLAAADDKTVALSFGGGSAFMKQLLDQARSKESTLDKDPGVQRVAARVPKDRSAVGYVAVDQIIACIREGQKAIDEEQLPVEMPIIDAPAVMTSTGAESWAQSELFVPTELIVATKTFIMAMTGGNAPPPGGPPAPAGGSN